MDYVTWVKAAERGALEGVYFCRISEPYLWDGMKKILEQNVVGDAMPDFNFECLSFPELDQRRLETALETMPVMAPRRVVILERMPLERNQLKTFEATLGVLSDYLDHPNPSVLLVLGFEGEKPFLGKLVKQLNKCAHIVDVSRLSPVQLRGFIQKKLTRANVRADQRVIDWVGGYGGYLTKNSTRTLYDVANEVDKLIASAQEGVLRQEIAEEVLIESVQDDVFRLTDALAERDTPKALKAYENLLDNSEDPFRLFYLVVRLFRNLISIRALSDRRIPDADGQKRIGISPFEYGKLKSRCGRFEMNELVERFEALYQLELKMKTRPTDLRSELAYFLVRSCERSR
ncbi:MAG: DNA polymerase III subunit delta [Ndongobacter sp.]|nr:DNA polymerase III subunit delta [Ndongobacter sp.]